MTNEQNIIAAAIQLMWAAERYGAGLAEFDDDQSACSEWAEDQDNALRQLDKAIQTAGIDWRDPAVRAQFRKGQGFR